MSGHDIAIIGSGIAGATAAFELSRGHEVVLLEREAQAAYHTTGRSAALYIETYGNAVMRALTVASGSFFRSPPAGFAPHPLLTPRGVVYVARHDQADQLQAMYEEGKALTPQLARLTTAQILEHCPVLLPEHAAAGTFEPDAMDIDVHALLTGYLRGAKERGATMVTNAEVLALDRHRDRWHLKTRAGEFSARIVVNAAGAWVDEVARLARARPLGLVPMRRTAITFDAPAGANVHAWPAVASVDESWYFKPEAGRVLASPADETPSPPCDAQPEEIDVATAVDRIEAVTSMRIRKLTAKWAGLRSFVPDRTIVAGFAMDVPGFFFLAGQGGYGIQTSPAMGRITASLIERGELPADVAALGIESGDLAPSRLLSSPA